MRLGTFRTLTASLPDDTELWLEGPYSSLREMEEFTVITSNEELPTALLLTPRNKLLAIEAADSTAK